MWVTLLYMYIISIIKLKARDNLISIPKENGQKDKQRSIKHYTEKQYPATRTPLKTGSNPGAPEG